MKRVYGRQGFTLLELLTVIAIIAILAAILFPVMKAAKDRAKTTACITHLHDIGVGLQTYRTDNNVYPTCLLGYFNTGLMMDSAKGGLYPEYVRDIKTFTCPSIGAGNVDSATVPLWVLNPGTGVPAQVTYYFGDSYDWTDQTGTGGAIPTYAKMWVPPGTGGGPPAAGAVDTMFVADPDKGNSEAVDYARQLRFRDPDATTVVTWCMNHKGTGKAQVLFLSGSVLPVSALKMSTDAVPGGLKVMYRAAVP
jgi:prepilin-type N-terminal cleavage/methylation domain-containing protein